MARVAPHLRTGCASDWSIHKPEHTCRFGLCIMKAKLSLRKCPSILKQKFTSKVLNLWFHFTRLRSTASHALHKVRFYLCNYQRYALSLKTVDTIGNCQRPGFSFGVSQHMHEITNLWKFQLNWSSKLTGHYERKKHPCHTKLCAFSCLISRPQILNLRSQNQILGKLFLSWKLQHLRGSRFTQCLILSTSPHYLLPSKVLCYYFILSKLPTVSTAFKCLPYSPSPKGILVSTSFPR